MHSSSTSMTPNVGESPFGEIAKFKQYDLSNRKGLAEITASSASCALIMLSC